MLSFAIRTKKYADKKKKAVQDRATVALDKVESLLDRQGALGGRSEDGTMVNENPVFREAVRPRIAAVRSPLVKGGGNDI
jgi:hypothetical protein